MSHGSIKVGQVRFEIVDCVDWRVIGRSADCRAGHDPAACESCPHRRTRGGDFQNPPVFLPYDPEAAGSPPRKPAGPSERSEPVAPAPRAAAAPRGTGGGKAEGWRGLGDVVAAATRSLGIQPCGGCKKRQETLNRIVPFSRGGGEADGS